MCLGIVKLYVYVCVFVYTVTMFWWNKAMYFYSIKLDTAPIPKMPTDIIEKSAQRDANTARALAVVRRKKILLFPETWTKK